MTAHVGLPLWKRWVLAGYLHASMPLRRRRNERAYAVGNAPVMVLFYHRVADRLPNDWTLPFTRFQAQIAWLQRNYDIVTLREAQRRVTDANNRPCVAITFDDGYEENCERALPHLLRNNIPFTYFVATDFILQRRPFPQDAARGCPLPPNTVDQLKELAGQGIEIGTHTRTHANLGPIRDRRRLTDEIVGCRDDLAEVLGQPVRYFAFPFGHHENLSQVAFEIAEQAGYAGVCSAYGGYNFPGDDEFHLQRIHADPEMVRLMNWLTVDPHKVRCVERFEYRRSGNTRG